MPQRTTAAVVRIRHAKRRGLPFVGADVGHTVESTDERGAVASVGRQSGRVGTVVEGEAAASNRVRFHGSTVVGEWEQQGIDADVARRE